MNAGEVSLPSSARLASLTQKFLTSFLCCRWVRLSQAAKDDVGITDGSTRLIAHRFRQEN
jgi:hypothetical protein